MTNETASAVITALEEVHFPSIYADAIGSDVEEQEGEDTFKAYAVMFNVETDRIFMLEYATEGNGWAETAESQNPWICLGYVSAEDIMAGDPAGFLTERVQEIIG